MATTKEKESSGTSNSVLLAEVRYGPASADHANKMPKENAPPLAVII